MTDATNRFTPCCAFWLWVMVVAAGQLVGCTGTTHRDPELLPDPFTVRVSARTVNGQMLFYRLNSDGQLDFAGGVDMIIDSPSPEGQLTDEQRLELWQLVLKHDLLEAKGPLLPAQFDQVRYELDLRAGAYLNHLTAVDAEQPGVALLHDCLRQIHREFRMNEVMAPIQQEMQRRASQQASP